MFVKGKSGNPGGRSKALVEVEKAAKEHTQLALDTLVEVASNREQPGAARVTAAVALLDRAWGKPKQQVDATVSVTGDLAEALEAARARVRGG